MAQLALTNVINISVSAASTGIGNYNVNNLGLFTNEAHADSFGDDGFALYLSPTQVGVDFGTDSLTYEMANSVFSQQPNILAGNGYLAIIPFLPPTQSLTFSDVAASGSFTLVYNGGSSASIPFSALASAIQTTLRNLSGLSQVVVAGSIASELLTLTLYGQSMDPSALSVGSNTLENGGSSSISITPAITASQETLAEAIVRTQGLVQYFGIMTDSTTDQLGSAQVLAAATAVQPLNKMLFVVSASPSALGSSGIITAVQQLSDTHTRCLYYGGADNTPLDMLSGYAGRALSTNFLGSNTTETMHLKQLVGVLPDPTMTQTLLNQALVAGADTYVSLQGVPAVFTSGANQYFDQVYNLQWLVGALQVAGFNYLAETGTKVPQTEQGMTGLKGAYRAVLQQAVANQYLAPGSWASPDTFGNQLDFLTNVSQLGYYIYSQPVSQQNQAARVARQAPLVQIAAKEAGAIQSSDVLILVNA